MSVEELVKELRIYADLDARSGEPLGIRMRKAADKLEELAAENERVRRERVEANNEWRKAYNELTVKTEAALAEKYKEIAALREALGGATLGRCGSEVTIFCSDSEEADKLLDFLILAQEDGR